MEMFQFYEFDLERTTVKSTIMVYTSLDSSFGSTFLRLHLANTASASFVLIDSTVLQWRFPTKLAGIVFLRSMF